MPRLIRECDDAISMGEVYPLSELGALTRDQVSALEDATHEAMRPFVEASWAEHDIEVEWVPRDRLAHLTGPSRWDLDEGEEGTADDLGDLSISVWSVAYARLDDSAVWRTALGGHLRVAVYPSQFSGDAVAGVFDHQGVHLDDVVGGEAPVTTRVALVGDAEDDAAWAEQVDELVAARGWRRVGDWATDDDVANAPVVPASGRARVLVAASTDRTARDRLREAVVYAHSPGGGAASPTELARWSGLSRETIYTWIRPATPRDMEIAP